MKTKIISLLIGCTLAFCIANTQAQTGTVRGKLIEINNLDTLTVSSVAVTLADAGDQRTIPVYSGSDGMFVINEVVAKPYTIEIWVNGLKKEPIRYTIQVSYSGNYHYFDIAPIAVKRGTKKEE